MLIYLALASVAMAQSLPEVPASYSVNINITSQSSQGVAWNYFAGYYAPGKVSRRLFAAFRARAACRQWFPPVRMHFFRFTVLKTTIAACT